MTWAMHHSKSEELASLAEIERRRGNHEAASALYADAAKAEVSALAQLDPSKPRTLGITYVSAASLWFKANDLDKAEKTILQGLATELPAFAVLQLKDLLTSVWSEQSIRQSTITFGAAELLVSVSGGDVRLGGAPLDLVQRKVDEVAALVFRTIEFKLGRPFRRRGGPSAEIAQQFRPWVFQAAPGSYQFAIRIERPSQPSLFPEYDVNLEADRVISNLLEIIKATVEEPETKLPALVPDTDYRQVFLKLTRNLAPTPQGKTFSRIELRPKHESYLATVALMPEARENINHTIRTQMARSEEPTESLEELRGVLRGLQLDNDWLEVKPTEDAQVVRVFEAGDMIDDVVGPMVNHRVVLTVSRRRDNRLLLRDIQFEE